MPTKSDHPATVVAREPALRSAAVARVARMPVATLRIWEQRYGAVRPAKAPSGHRRYSPQDVQRVLLLRRLTERGHAIGSIAGLETAQLQGLAQALEADPAQAGVAPIGTGGVARVAVVGTALALRLQRPAIAARIAASANVVVVFESLVQAAATAGSNASVPADLLIWHAPEMQPQLPTELHAVRDACGARSVAVLYRFAGADARRAMADAGVAVRREPTDDEALAAWLASVCGRREPPSPQGGRQAAVLHPLLGEPAPVPPRRYDDTTLTAIAGLSPTLACECPRHLAELLMQLSSFETYSAGCVNRSPADARLHAHLQHVAGSARTLLESALERVARHEGLQL